MAAESAGTPMLPADLSAAVTSVADRVAQSFGDRLGGVVLYGSLLRGGYRPRRSDVNLLVVLDKVTSADLTAVAELAQRERKVRLAPAVVTADDLKGLARSAPSTVWDIWDHHLVLAGDDPLIGLRCELADLARQLRGELRDKLLRLRAEWPPAGPPEALVREAFASALHLLRNALRLYGKPASGDSAVVIGELARTLRLDLPTLQRLYALHYGDDRLGRADAESLYDLLLRLHQDALAALESIDLSRLPVGAKQREQKAKKPAPPAKPTAAGAAPEPAPESAPEPTAPSPEVAG